MSYHWDQFSIENNWFPKSRGIRFGLLGNFESITKELVSEKRIEGDIIKAIETVLAVETLRKVSMTLRNAINLFQMEERERFY